MAIDKIADSIQTAGFDGFMVDYEPADNYTQKHVDAYANFLSHLSGALHKINKKVGADVAGIKIFFFFTKGGGF